jgi:hypothetical protein
MREVPEVFAERKLHFRSPDVSRNIVVQIGPIDRRDGAAVCQYKLTGFDQAVSRKVWGFDDIQALQLAMVSIGAELDRLGGSGNFGVEGDSDGEVGHGFPR